MRLRRFSAPAVVALALVATSLTVGGSLQSASSAGPAPAPASAPVAKPLGKAAVAKAKAHLQKNPGSAGLSAADAADLVVSSVVPTAHNGLTNVYFQQRANGLDVAQSIVNVAVRADGSVFRVASNAVEGAEKSANATSPTISDVAAAQAAADALGLKPTEPFASDDAASGAARARELGDGGISQSAIPVRLVYQRAAKGDLRLAWELVIDQLDGQHWWQITIDATSGDEVNRIDWVANDSHNVYPLPVEAPSFAGSTTTDLRTVVNNPANGTASPFGWNDTNGVAGAESTLTIGNNVNAYTDVDANNVPDAGSSPNGGAGLNFNFPLDLTQPPSAYRPAAVSNLFFTNNRIHDIMYRYGFTEAAGNFQVNNYGRGGTGNDAVNAEAQDGSGTNNANFATPADGLPPRMQMYIWTAPTPDRDGDLDNGIIIHEYGHGISNRLTGGPAVTGCLNNSEQGGEGWSDYFALMLTMASGTEPAGGRGIGTYALNEPTTGPGIRTQRYSTNMAINNETYDTIKTMAVPHGVGEVWATMLNEVTWAMIGRYGFSADLIGGNAGNNRALQLVLDGLKLQPCLPGFVDARNAIIAADQAAYGGANKCLLWGAFAKRGLGFSATQGSSGSTTDGTQAFDLPPDCLGVTVTRTATPSPVPAARQLTYGYQIANTSANPAGITGVSVTGKVGEHANFVPGSATCGGTYDAGTKVVTFPIGSMALGASTSCQFKVVIDASPFTVLAVDDDFEPDASGWTATHGSGTVDWALTTTNPHSPTNAVFASEPNVLSDQYLTLTAPVTVTAGDQLTFWQRRGFENTFDGGVVEVSTNNGTTWSDIGAANWVSNGYNATISTGFSSPIAGRQAFSGTLSTYVQSVADLTPYAGQTIRLRFRAATDTSVSGGGWTIDDVRVGRIVSTTSLGTASTSGAPTQNIDVTTEIVAPIITAPDAPTVTGSTPSKGAVSVAFTPGYDGGNAITGHTAECLSTNGGATGTATGGASPINVTGLSAGKSYHCHVKSTNGIGTSPYSEFGPTVAVPAISKPGKPKIKKVTVVSSSKVKVKFKKPKSDGGDKITKYQVSCSSKDGGKTKKATGKKSPITVKKLSAGKDYKCKVRAKNSAGWGKWSKASKKVHLPGKNHREAARHDDVSARVERLS